MGISQDTLSCISSMSYGNFTTRLRVQSLNLQDPGVWTSRMAIGKTPAMVTWAMIGRDYQTIRSTVCDYQTIGRDYQTKSITSLTFVFWARLSLEERKSNRMARGCVYNCFQDSTLDMITNDLNLKLTPAMTILGRQRRQLYPCVGTTKYDFKTTGMWADSTPERKSTFTYRELEPDLLFDI